jgi:HPt (histidine-containing phosphotransfer) domain-containing protein
MPSPAKPRKARSPKKTPETPIVRPDIAALSARIAKDNARISRFMESLVNHVDLIVDAAAAEDWQEVERQADYLAGGGATHGCAELSERATELSAMLKSSGDSAQARRQVIRLIGACGRARQSDVASPK